MVAIALALGATALSGVAGMAAFYRSRSSSQGEVPDEAGTSSIA